MFTKLFLCLFEVSNLHFVFAADAAFAFDLEFEFVDGFFELHLILEQLLYFFETVANYDLELFLFDGEDFSISGDFFASALF